MKKLWVFIPLVLLLFQCQKERDEYFEIPDWVEGPLYEILQGEGRFDLFLQCVDRTQYAASLKGNGLWTIFAPNDDAVNAYLRQKGYASVADIPQAEVNKLVSYTMLFNKYELNRLTDVLSSGWDTLQSIKKKTPYYETLHREFNGADSIWVVDANDPAGYRTGDNNYKYLPFYLDRYFSSRQVPLTAGDYNTFYSSPYTGRNIQGASVVKSDIMAGNGIIHEIDKVNEPLPTIERILEEDEYSGFKSLIEKKGPTGVPYFYGYYTFSWLTEYFKTMYPSRNIDQIYCKVYTGTTIPINNERFSTSDKESETNGFTIFAPNNTAVQKFYDEVIKDYYASVDQLPSNVMGFFINAQMVDEMVWPGGYKNIMNKQGDYINGVGSRGPGLDKSVYTDIRPASNGFFYGSNDYVKSHYFETVYTEILLRPSSYSLMYNALQKYFISTLLTDLTKCTLNGYTEEDYTILLPSDEILKEEGFTWEWTGSAYGFRHQHEGTSGTTFADNRIQRLIRSHVFKRIRTNEIDTRILDFTGNASGDYDGYAYAVNDYGDMIRYKNNQLQMLGNHDANDWITVTHIRTFSNGQVFGIDKLLDYSQCKSTTECDEQDLLVYMKQAAIDNPDISMYVEYMEYIMTNAVNPYVLSKESFWTLLIPNNTALTQAIADGYLQPLSDIKTAAGTGNPAPLQKATDFFKFHIIPGTVYVNDGYEQMVLNSGKVQPNVITTTALKILIDNTFLKMEKIGGNLRFSSYRSSVASQASVVPGVEHSNLFGPKSVLHEIDNYLVFKPE